MVPSSTFQPEYLFNSVNSPDISPLPSNLKSGSYWKQRLDPYPTHISSHSFQMGQCVHWQWLCKELRKCLCMRRLCRNAKNVFYANLFIKNYSDSLNFVPSDTLRFEWNEWMTFIFSFPDEQAEEDKKLTVCWVAHNLGHWILSLSWPHPFPSASPTLILSPSRSCFLPIPCTL